MFPLPWFLPAAANARHRPRAVGAGDTHLLGGRDGALSARGRTPNGCRRSRPRSPDRSSPRRTAASTFRRRRGDPVEHHGDDPGVFDEREALGERRELDGPRSRRPGGTRRTRGGPRTSPCPGPQSAVAIRPQDVSGSLGGGDDVDDGPGVARVTGADICTSLPPQPTAPINRIHGPIRIGVLQDPVDCTSRRSSSTPGHDPSRRGDVSRPHDRPPRPPRTLDKPAGIWRRCAPEPVAALAPHLRQESRAVTIGGVDRSRWRFTSSFRGSTMKPASPGGIAGRPDLCNP